VAKLYPVVQRSSLRKVRSKWPRHRSRLSRPMRRPNFCPSSVATYWSYPAAVSLGHMRWAQDANAKSGCFVSRNLLLLL
jgi:hypothetical protein